MEYKADLGEYYTPKELAEKWKLSPRTIERFVQRKELPALRIGRQLRFKKEWVDNYEQAHQSL